MLLLHRKAYYMLVFTKQATGRHWVDTIPYVRKNHALYFSSPSQLLVKAALLGPDGPTSQFFSDDNAPETGISPW